MQALTSLTPARYQDETATRHHPGGGEARSHRVPPRRALFPCCPGTAALPSRREFCQGPRNVDLRTPPGQECSNGSLLCICRGHPGIFSPI
jgi:hypothetical protein